MHPIIRANALKSTVGSLIPNAGPTWWALRSDPVVYLTGPEPNLLSVLLPAVFMSALVTTLLTYAALTGARKRGQLLPPLPETSRWIPAALLTSLVTSLVFVLPLAAGIGSLSLALAEVKVSRMAMIAGAMGLGAVAALLAALVASTCAQVLVGLARE